MLRRGTTLTQSGLHAPCEKRIRTGDDSEMTSDPSREAGHLVTGTPVYVGNVAEAEIGCMRCMLKRQVVEDD